MSVGVPLEKRLPLYVATVQGAALAVGGALQERHDQGGTCGADAVPLFGHQIDQKKLMKETIHHGHRQLRIDHFTHNNQPKTGCHDKGEYG